MACFTCVTETPQILFAGPAVYITGALTAFLEEPAAPLMFFMGTMMLVILLVSTFSIVREMAYNLAKAQEASEQLEASEDSKGSKELTQDEHVLKQLRQVERETADRNMQRRVYGTRSQTQLRDL